MGYCCCVWSLLLYCVLLQAPRVYNSTNSWWGTVTVCGPYCYTGLILQAPLGYNSIIAGGVLLLCVVLIVILCFITGATGYNSTNSWWGTNCVWSLLLYCALLQAPLVYNRIHSWWGTVTVCGPYCYTVFYYRRDWFITAPKLVGYCYCVWSLLLYCVYITGATGYNSTNSWWGAVCGPYCYTVFYYRRHWVITAPIAGGVLFLCVVLIVILGLYYRRHWVITASIAGGLLLLCAVLIVILCFITGATGL